MIPDTFLRHAADILGDTRTGLSGTKIIEATAAYAVEFNVAIPHTQMGMHIPNKRTALYENLRAFSPKQQYKIIKELCDHPNFGDTKLSERKGLKLKLITRFRHLDPEPEASELNQPLIEDTRHWLGEYPDALSLYGDALQKYKHGAFSRNVLDDLRLSLEKLLHALFDNEKSLENQKAAVGAHIKNHGGSAQLSNMFVSLLSYYCQYQNDYVKHDDAIIEEEIEFVIEITSSFMKHLVRLTENG
ncbi:hypothetical protein GC207_09805 [bacterium]|nr:hypothetical protein [bacterium]